MNIVYVETQRKDGTWKTWDNVAIPVKFGKQKGTKEDETARWNHRLNGHEFG